MPDLHRSPAKQQPALSRFRPLAKMTSSSSSSKPAVLRDHNPKHLHSIDTGGGYDYSSPEKSDTKQTMLHVATPAKQKMGFFSSSASQDTPSVPAIPAKIRSGISSGAHIRSTGSQDLPRPSSRAALAYPTRSTTPHSQAQTTSRRISTSSSTANSSGHPSSIRMVASTPRSHQLQEDLPNPADSGTASPGALKRLWIQSGLGATSANANTPTGRSIGKYQEDEGMEILDGNDDGDEGEVLGMGMDELDVNAGRDGSEKQGKGEGVVVTIRIRPPTQSSGNVWHTPSSNNHSGTNGAASSSRQVLRLADGMSGSAGMVAGGGAGGAGGLSGKEWGFDQVLSPSSTNRQTYYSAAKAHVQAAMLGFNSVVFAYGQTASGKTHTLTGTPQEPGVIPQSVDEIFHIIRNNPSREWLLRASYLELYNESLNDLLSPGTSSSNDITILNGKKEGEIQIQGLTEMVVTNKEEVRKVLKMGEGRRRTGCTDWNERSSRSHSVFRIVIESKERSGGNDDAAFATPARGGRSSGNAKATRMSCLSLIDLAGSEKATASKERNAEGRHINQSLLTLKNVISKLTEHNGKKTAGHIPYRDSKLTRLLQPSLSGDAKISVICTINPSASSIPESQSTLAFASGIKKVVLRAKQTEVVDPAALIQQYQNEIAELKAKLAEKDRQDAGGPVRMTLPEREERVHFNKRLTELKRLILTSNNVDEEEAYSTSSPSMRSSSPTKIDHERSQFSLQEELHVAQRKTREQQLEIERLKRELSCRPANADQRVMQLEENLARSTLMIREYEQNLLDPGQKVREDVEAEYLPRIAALEERAREKEQFYRELYDSVHILKSENARLKERCERLEAEKGTFVEIVKELEMNGVAFTGSPSRDSGIALGKVSPAKPAGNVANEDPRVRDQDDAYEAAVKPMTTRMSSVSSITLDRMRKKLVIAGTGEGMGMKTLREDSMFDLASRAAYVDREDDDEDVF